MLLINDIRRIYNEYLAESARISSLYKPSDGLMGMGRGADSDPSHDRFREKLEASLEAAAAGGPSSHDVAEALRFMYDTPVLYKDNQLVYWMLVAAHAMTEKIVRFLSPEDAARLYAGYSDAYPKSGRLPAQKKAAALLQKQAGGSTPVKRNSFFGFLKGRGH